MSTYYTTLPTPIGQLFIEGTDEAVTRIWFEGENVSFPIGRVNEKRGNENEIVKEAKRQLEEYFAGQRTEFDLPLVVEGTDFQLAVWKALSTIRYGETRTYGQITAAIGRPVTAARGIGQACGHNPLPVLVPCHRVVGKSGSLTGFGGGVWRKEWLLEHEKRHAPEM